MIKRIRSAVICGQVESTPEGVNYLGVHGDELLAESRPGFVEAWISLHLELDEKPTKWRVELRADKYEQTIRGEQTAGLGMIAVAFPFLAPVLRDGVLTAAVFNEGRPDSVGAAGWRLGFEPDPQTLSQDAGRKIVREAKRHADEVRAALTHRQREPGQTAKIN